jgi:hypothetical protein
VGLCMPLMLLDNVHAAANNSWRRHFLCGLCRLVLLRTSYFFSFAHTYFIIGLRAVE